MSGDYQTAERMAAKLGAVPLPDDLTGKTLLDVGCDHGEWCRIASERGAKRVVGLDRGRYVRGPGFVDLAARNTAQDWPRCEFINVDVAQGWPDLGAFDVVLALSIYHHLYGAAGDHVVIWKWLRERTRELCLWEGPVDTRDPVAHDRAKPHGGYTREAIMQAAKEHFLVEHVGPAIHRKYREVWRCLPR
jgi:SAM-dependent methyltransferase